MIGIVTLSNRLFTLGKPILSATHRESSAGLRQESPGGHLDLACDRDCRSPAGNSCRSNCNNSRNGVRLAMLLAWCGLGINYEKPISMAGHDCLHVDRWRPVCWLMVPIVALLCWRGDHLHHCQFCSRLHFLPLHHSRTSTHFFSSRDLICTWTIAWAIGRHHINSAIGDSGKSKCRKKDRVTMACTGTASRCGLRMERHWLLPRDAGLSVKNRHP